MSPPRRPFAGLNNPDVVSRVCLLVLGGILFWAVASRLLTDRDSAEFARAQRRLAEGRLRDAESRFRALLAERPDDVKLRADVLKACALEGRWGLVVSFGEEALARFRSAPPATRARLCAAVSEGYLAGKVGPDWRRKALERARTAYELDRYDPVMLNAYGYALADLKENLRFADILLSDALAETDAAPPTRENRLLRAQILDSYGWLRYRQGDAPGAVKALDRALALLTGEDAPAAALKVLHYHLGAAYRAADRPEDARLALNVALRHDRHYREAREELRLLDAPPPAPR